MITKELAENYQYHSNPDKQALSVCICYLHKCNYEQIIIPWHSRPDPTTPAVGSGSRPLFYKIGMGLCSKKSGCGDYRCGCGRPERCQNLAGSGDLIFTDRSPEPHRRKSLYRLFRLSRCFFDFMLFLLFDCIGFIVRFRQILGCTKVKAFPDNSSNKGSVNPNNAINYFNLRK